MAFNLFKSKKRLLDLRNHDDIELSIKNRSKSGVNSSFDPNTGNIIESNNQTPVSSTPASTQSSGGFFDFFGNPTNSGSGSSNSSSSLTSDSSISSGAVSDVNSSRLREVEGRLNDISDRFSRLMDRVDLIDKKLDRLERRNGVGGY